MGDEYTTVESDGFIVSSSNETVESMAAALAPPEPAEEAPAQGEPPAETPAPEQKEPEPADGAGKERNADGTFRAKDKKSNPVARMQDATAKEAAAKRERDEIAQRYEADRAQWQREREEYNRRLTPEPAAAPRRAGLVEGEPDPQDTAKYPDGQYDAKYIADLVDFRSDQRIEARMQAERQQARQRYEAQAWQQQLTAARQATPDWDTRINPETPLDRRVMPFIRAQADGPQILLYLSEHQDVAQRLATLHPVAQIGEIGKIQARIEAASSGTVSRPVVSHAPAPITPLGGGHSAGAEAARDDEPFEHHFKRENARERQTVARR